MIKQLLVAIAPDWNSVEGKLYRYERTSPLDPWTSLSAPIAIALGKSGLAWGIGLRDVSSHQGLHKLEGDERSPAGLFALGPVFGDPSYASHIAKMPFIPVREDLECIDDPHSTHYNQLISVDSIAHKDWKSSENFKSIGSLYHLGIFIQHNTHPPLPGRGSAIFMHIWRAEGSGTAGCTVMEEKALADIAAWLDFSGNPCLLQLPLKEYLNKKERWDLPELPH